MTGERMVVIGNGEVRERIYTKCTRSSSSSISSLSLSWLRSEPPNPEDMLGKDV